MEGKREEGESGGSSSEEGKRAIISEGEVVGSVDPSWCPSC
jgi:hypothetical protein